jgi:tRNA(fMet)-specific endonuclease VapC
MYELDKKFNNVRADDLYISEITLAELKYGVEKSEKKDKNRKALDLFLTGVKVVPIFHALDLYALEKARLIKSGNRIDDFDLLIGVTAVTNNFIMVTNNTAHFQWIHKIKLEDWTIPAK